MLLSTHPADKIEDAVVDVLPRLHGAFSTVVMTGDKIVAFRDPHGLRPLALAEIGPHGKSSVRAERRTTIATTAGAALN